MDEILRLARPEIVAMAPYSSARTEGEQNDMSVYLDANENPYPPFPGTATEDGLNRYPEPQPRNLIERFAELYSVMPQSVFLSRGADEAIDLLVRIFCAAGKDAILITPPAFPMYETSAAIQSAAVVRVPLLPEAGFQLDVDGVIAAVHNDEHIKLVFICSPNNPTSNLMRRSDVVRVAGAVFGRALVIVDQTYVEYSGEQPLSNEIAAHPNIAVLRTLSKEYSLAGERIGITVANPDVIGLLRRVMAPYSLTQSSIRAATSAVSAEGIERARDRQQLLVAERKRLESALAGSAAVERILPSDANFLIVKTSNPQLLVQIMEAAGIKIRDRSTLEGLAGCVRISAGTPPETDAFLRAWKDYEKQVSAS